MLVLGRIGFTKERKKNSGEKGSVETYKTRGKGMPTTT